MSQISEAESRLIADIYDATLDPGRWSAVIRALAELTRADKANVLAFDRLNPDYFLFHSHGTSPEDLERYQAGGFATQDMEFAGKWFQKAGGLGKAVANHHYDGGLEAYIRDAGPLFSEFFARVGIHFQLGGLLEKTDFRWSVVGLHRGPDGQAFEDDAIATVTRLMPHLRRALQIHRQLAGASQRHARLYRLLDGLTTGVLLLDGGSHIRYANAEAERLLQQHNGLTVGSHHDLRAGAPASQAELQSLLQGAISTSQRTAATAVAGGVMACTDSRSGHLLMLTVVPLSEMAGYEELASDGIAAAIFLTDPRSRHRLCLPLLRSSFGLTERESELCQAFVNHPTLEGVAAACRLSLSSVRTYMKEIYAKTGRRSQSELMHLLMGLRLDFEHIR